MEHTLKIPSGAHAAADRTPATISDEWFAAGERIGYDPAAKRIDAAAPLRIWTKHEGDVAHAVTFLPGFPDGSSGWARVAPFLPEADVMPKLFFDYLGMGDSDKPRAYRYSTAERTDLVEALWAQLGVRSTTLVAFDFSSLVVLEHLRRRLDGGPGPDIRGAFIFNGGLFVDGHSHPWFTTPVLRRMPAALFAPLARPRSFSFFKMMAGPMWSSGYPHLDEDARDLRAVLARHDGTFFLSAGAGFLADHRAQGRRLDFGSLYPAFAERFPFFVGGSDEDRFEHRQVDLVEARLPGVRVARLPGGHLTTHERPAELAALMAAFETDVAGHAP